MSPRPECTVVLASASPRRRRLIDWLGIGVHLTAVDTPEELDGPLASDPPRLACALAAEKATAAAEESPPDSLVLAFDTIVVLDGEVLGKPRDVPDAWRMLRALSGRTHEVVTGVALLDPGSTRPRTFPVVTNVRMKPLSDCQIEAWMALGEFLGCAGAYNIEGQVAEVDIDECYQNVAGLPLCHVFAALTGDSSACSVTGEVSSPIAPCDAALRRTCALGPGLVASALSDGERER